MVWNMWNEMGQRSQELIHSSLRALDSGGRGTADLNNRPSRDDMGSKDDEEVETLEEIYRRHDRRRLSVKVAGEGCC